MFAPKTGDLLLRGSNQDGFVVLDAVTREALSTALPILEALAFAKVHGGSRVWQQQLDFRGRGIGQPSLLPHR